MARICLRPYSTATVRVRLVTAAFAVAYGAAMISPKSPSTDEVVMIDPPPRASMAGIAARIPKKTPVSATCMLLSQTSGSISCT